MASHIPYPPPPEFGWYDDDSAGIDADAAFVDADNTVVSRSSSTTGTGPTHHYRMCNDTTGQTVDLTTNTLLGRKPSQDLPQGAVAVALADPTRTISRNHAAISFDPDGTMWIEDQGSLNGTYLIVDGAESQVVKGVPARVTIPCTIRIGDQFFRLEGE